MDASLHSTCSTQYPVPRSVPSKQNCIVLVNAGREPTGIRPVEYSVLLPSPTGYVREQERAIQQHTLPFMQHLLDGGDRFVSARILCPEICQAELYLQEKEGEKN